ncbi:MAG: alpha-glucosidase [Spirochaetota bacterium]
MKYWFAYLIVFIHCLSCLSTQGKINTQGLKEASAAITDTVSYSYSKDKLTIFQKDSKRVFIAFNLQKPFLTAASSIPEVSYSLASFEFDEEIQYRCSNQDLSVLKVENGSLFLSGKLTGKRCNTAYNITLKPENDNTVSFSVNLMDEKLNRIYLSYQSNSQEQFFGFGEQFSHFNLKGHKLYLFNEEQGLGRGDQPITFGANWQAKAGGNEYSSYAPIPHYITTDNRSVFYENSAYSTFDLTQEDEVKVEFWERNLEGTIWLANSPLDLIEVYTQKTGRFRKLPDWAYGTWMGLQGGKDTVVKHVDQAVKAGNPVTALWIQDWEGKRKTVFGSQLWWLWRADEKTYPDFRNFVKEMNSKNIKVLGYINSFLANEGKMFEEARDKGLLVKDRNGNDYVIKTVGFPAYLIDQTNPKTRKWLKEVIKKNMIDMGLSGWMADFGEWLPFDAKLHSGISAEVYHNRYSVDWAQLNMEAIQEAGKEGEIVFFNRSGYSYSNKYSTLFWEGDQMVSFGKNDGIASTVVGLLSGGVSGISLNHSDIGGYTTINNPLADYHRSEELFLRWTELNAFTPIFRTHEGNRPKENHQPYTDEKTVKFFAKFGKVHYALKDYLKHLVDEANTKGYPVVRHPYLHYPNDKNTWSLKYQFLLGEDVLVLPVLNAGKTSVKGYFPKGKWKNVWTGKIQAGGISAEVGAPIGSPAVYVKEGGAWSAKIYQALQNIK